MYTSPRTLIFVVPHTKIPTIIPSPLCHYLRKYLEYGDAQDIQVILIYLRKTPVYYQVM